MHLIHLAFFLFFCFFCTKIQKQLQYWLKHMSVEKHYSSLKPHFTLTIFSPALYYTFQLFGHCLLHMVKVERCTCSAKHCFLKFKIAERFFVLLKRTGSQKSTKRAITKMHWLCGQVSGNILGFFLKTIIFFSWANIFRLPNIASRWYLKITGCYSHPILYRQK